MRTSSVVISATLLALAFGTGPTQSLDGTPSEPWSEFASAAVAELSRRHGMAAESAQHLVDRYGRHAAVVAAYIEALATFCAASATATRSSGAISRILRAGAFGSTKV